MNKSLIVCLVILGGCHTEAPRVRCDRDLQPINAPAPSVKEPSAARTPLP
jgi:hypothetical protein